MINVGIFGAVSTIAAAFAIYNAYYIKQQFFPICIYLVKSSASMLALVTFALYCMFIVAYLTKTALFGTLRLIETEHLQEYGWLTISESFLAMTIFRDEFDARFVLIFTTVLFIKAFHWIARDRVDYMEQIARLSQVFHLRMALVITLLTGLDLVGLYACVRHVIRNGPSMAILFGNEFALLLVSLLSIMVRYTLNATDMRRGSVWEHRSIFLFYYDFLVDFLKLIIYSTFFGIVVAYYGVPLHIIRDLYLTIRSFIIRIKDIIRYRRATANMNERYPDATPEELTGTDRVCIICRDEMVMAKKLPCGHLFHFRCLRSWLERQQACPTCRRPILEENAQVPLSPTHPAPPVVVEGENPRPLPGALIWQNGRWERVPTEPDPNDRPDGGGGGIPINNPNPQERHEPLDNNAAPAIVFPNLQSPVSGSIVTGPFGTVPVILIPPEQIAIVHPPQPPQIPDSPRNTTTTTLLDDHVVPPPRPHSTSPTTATNHRGGGVSLEISKSALTKPLYVLKSGDGGQSPIYLEPIGSEFPITTTTPVERHSTNPLNDTVADIIADKDITVIRKTIQRQLRLELATLSQLQVDITALTERLIAVETQLDSIDQTFKNIGKSRPFNSDSLKDSPHPFNSQADTKSKEDSSSNSEEGEEEDDDSSNTLMGKQKV